MTETFIAASVPPAEPAAGAKKPLYASLWFQVVVAMVLAVAVGHFSPAWAVAMKPLGDAFIRLISMVITLIIFCTVVSGIAGMDDMRKVGRVGDAEREAAIYKTMKADKRAIFTASAKAQQAADLLLGSVETEEEIAA